MTADNKSATELSSSQALVFSWIKRLDVPATPELISHMRYTRENKLSLSRVKSALDALKKNGLVENIIESDGIERWLIAK